MFMAFVDAIQMIHKEAAEKKPEKPKKKRRRYHYLFGERIKKREAKNIEKALKDIAATTPEERKVEQLAGKKPTKKQIARWAAIGGAGGVLTDVAGAAIGGGEKWIPKPFPTPRGQGRAVLHPRRLAQRAAIGAIYGAAVPITRRLADIEAAKRGEF